MTSTHGLCVDLIPSIAEQRIISELLEEMTTYGVVIGRLQREQLSASSVRDIFDVVIDEYEGMKDYLTSDADIVVIPEFESGLVKLQSAAEATLTSRRPLAPSPPVWSS